MRHVLDRSSARARRRVVAVGAVVVVVGLLAGCTGEEPVDPEPSSSTTESPERTEEPEPTPTETGPVKPARPAEMEQHDAEGAAAAAEYFVELYPYVMTTGDTAEWDAMSHEACESCAGFVQQAKSIAERGDVFTGGEIEASVADPERHVRDDLTGIFSLDLSYSQGVMSVTSSTGEELLAAEASSAERRVEMGIRGDDWVVVTIAEVPQ